MPVKGLPPSPDLNHLKSQAKDLLRAHASRDPQVAQRIREFHPKFHGSTDAEIFDIRLRLSDAQLIIARESGFASWASLKRRVQTPKRVDNLELPHHERIEDPIFRRAVELLDKGDIGTLSDHLNKYPNLVHQHVTFEGGNYFRNPSLLNFVAENPIRRGALPANIVEVAKLILDAGAKEDQSILSETLGLVCSGRITREYRVQIPLIDLLCEYGADPNIAMLPALGHGEFEAVEALIRNGARVDLAATAALGRSDDFSRLLPNAKPEDCHLALAFASQFGRTEIVVALLDAGEDPNRYNPLGAHSHSTPLHQAVAFGHENVVRMLVERGARLDIKDILWQGTPAGWARHEGKTEIEQYLRAQEKQS